MGRSLSGNIRRGEGSRSQNEAMMESSSSSNYIPVVKLAFLFAFVVVTVISSMNNLSQTSTVKMPETQTRTLQQQEQQQVSTGTSTATQTSTSSTTTAAAGIDPGTYPPFSCHKLLEDLKTNPAIQALDPNRGRVHALRVINQPSFYVSLHNRTFDKTRWEMMTWGFYYERKLTECFHEVLKESPPGARVLDVGGNIGIFSLTSASVGPFIIDTFEPNLKNRMRFCESLNINRWFQTEFDAHIDTTKPRMNPYPFGVGAEDGFFGFQEHRNPGQGAVTVRTESTNPKAIQLVTLDNFAKERGWFETRPHIAILKVDVEGFEYSVFAGARELIRAKIIRNIFTEISVRTHDEVQQNLPFLNFLAFEAGYELYKVGGWSGPAGDPLNWPKDEQYVDKITELAKKEGAKQLNLWWKSPDQKASS